MKERPILFNSAMVRALLDGRKTQTRRVIKPPKDENIGSVYEMFDNTGDVPEKYAVFGCIPTNESRSHYGVEFACPYGQPGDRLWVRETWQIGWNGKPMYRADFATPHNCGGAGWKSPYHMRREHSRITLEVKAVRVERVQEITPDDCRAEGVGDSLRDVGARYVFGQLWNSINEARGYGWAVNPWVWVVEFERVKEGA
jgi:hypothetical protein